MGTFRTVDYVDGADPRRRLDIFSAAPDRDLNTTVLVIHGGGFRHGDRSAVHPRCEALAALGITAVAVGYRMLDDDVSWPAPLADVRDALRWTGKRIGELGGDPGRIVVQGHSAGAALALLTAGRALGEDTPPVSAVVAFYAADKVSLTPAAGEFPAGMLFGAAATADAANAASALTYIDEHYPPTLLIHGATDRLVAPVASLRLFDALTSAGVRTELHLAAGQDHEFDMAPRYNHSMSSLVVDFLRAEIVEAELAAKEVADFNPFASMPTPEAGPR
jgi:acetyl esterase/lipase